MSWKTTKHKVNDDGSFASTDVIASVPCYNGRAAFIVALDVTSGTSTAWKLQASFDEGSEWEDVSGLTVVGVSATNAYVKVPESAGPQPEQLRVVATGAITVAAVRSIQAK